MKLPATNLLLPLLLLLSWLGGGAIEAQAPTSDFAFWLVPSVADCTGGDDVTIDLYLQISPTAPAATPLQGFTVGVCHDTSVLALVPSSVVMGNWITSLQPCTAPDFLQVSEWGGTTGSAGYTIGTVFSFTGGCTLPVDCHHIATAEYTCAADAPLDSSVVSTCNTLGNPTVLTVVVYGGDSYTPLSEFISGSLPVECTYPAPGQMELNWTSGAAFDSFEIYCNGVVVATLPGSATSYLHFCDPTVTNCCIVRGNLCGVPIDSEPCCCETELCLELGAVTAVCNSDGSVGVTFEVANLSGLDAHKLFLPGTVDFPGGSATISPTVTIFTPALPGDGSVVATVEFFIDGAAGGALLEMPFALMHKDDSGNLEECCSDVLEVPIPVGCVGVRFIRGDANQDENISIPDAMVILDFLFNGWPVTCVDALDSNDSGNITITDAIKVLCALFCPGTPPPPAPFPDCGTDPTFDFLDCQSLPGCN